MKSPQINKTFNLQSFNTFILNSNQNQTLMIKQIRATQGEVQSVRFNLWRLLTGVFTQQQTTEEKLDSLSKQRLHYKDLVSKHIKGEDVVTKAPTKRDPLSKDSGNGQTSGYFENHELKNQIKIDIQRTYQEIPFFTNKRVITILTNVLFLWAKENKDISYIQGMNEVAASLIYIYFQECLGDNKSEIDDIALKFNDVNHAEADIYTLFKQIFNNAQHMEMFRPNYSDKQKLQMGSKKPSPILNRIAKLQDLQLKIVDIELFRHLKLLDVEIKVFLLRWLRCMFTREFQLLDSFLIWDNIFLEYYQDPKDNNLHLIDCLSLAMMSSVRGPVLEQEESSQCYQKFLKFPQIKDIRTLIDIAFHYKEILSDPNNAKEVMDGHLPVLLPKTETVMSVKKSSQPIQPQNSVQVPKMIVPPIQTSSKNNPIQAQTIKPVPINTQTPPPPQKYLNNNTEPQVKIKEEKVINPPQKQETVQKQPQAQQEQYIKFTVDDVQIIINALGEGLKNLKQLGINNQTIYSATSDMEEIKQLMENELEKQTKNNNHATLFGQQKQN